MRKEIFADWKDIDGLFNNILEILPEFGLYVNEHPDTIGSDVYGLIISDQPIKIEEVKGNEQI